MQADVDLFAHVTITSAEADFEIHGEQAVTINDGAALFNAGGTIAVTAPEIALRHHFEDLKAEDVVCDWPVTLPVVMGDPVALRRIIENLVSNGTRQRSTKATIAVLGWHAGKRIGGRGIRPEV